jgi:hypothetical protein
MEKLLTKQGSTILKGIAICLMLFLHLFNQKENVDLCTIFLYINGAPLVSLLSKFAGICVPMYLFLSGYGLYISFKEKKAKKSGLRILSLWLNYIIILLLFTGLGAVIAPEKYPGSLSEFILNVITWSCSYNPTWWFLFSYFILVLLNVQFFKLLNKFNSWLIFLVLSAIYFVTFLIIYYHFRYQNIHDIIYKPILVLNCLFSFGVGALFAKENIFAKFKQHFSIYLSIMIIILLIAIRIILPVTIFNPLFACAFITCCVVTKRTKQVDKILLLLGKYSTNMWLIHCFFCYYLFKDFIYSFKYPVLIFFVLLTFSLASSFIIDLIYKPLNKKLSQYIDKNFTD